MNQAVTVNPNQNHEVSDDDEIIIGPAEINNVPDQQVLEAEA